MIDGFYDRYMYTPMPEMHNEMIPVTVVVLTENASTVI